MGIKSIKLAFSNLYDRFLKVTILAHHYKAPFMSKIIILFTFLLFSGLALAQNGKYAVEVAAFAEPVKDGHFKEIANVYETLDVNYIYRYYLDADSREDAEAKRSIVIKVGFVNARVVDFDALQAQCNMTCQYIAPKATGNTIKPYIAKAVEIVTIPSLRCIFFDFDKHYLRPDAKFELNRLARLMKQKPSYSVEVDGHTDARGSLNYNEELSDKRASAAIQYLVNRGISADRITEKVYGESNPIAINEYPNGKDAARGRQYNRRVEFTIRDGRGEVLGIVNKIRVPKSLQKD